VLFVVSLIFAAAVVRRPSSEPASLADLNHDVRLDPITGNVGDSAVSVLLGVDGP
jgi:hypothetical protein